MSNVNDFDFLLGTWTLHNHRRNNPWGNDQDGIWEDFVATQTGVQYLDGKVQIEHFEGGTYSDGVVRKGLTIRSFDEQRQLWSIRWLDNRSPHDFEPLVGSFQDGVGLFYQNINTPDGRPVQVRFTWDRLSSQTPRWQQAFSYDSGVTWDTNWIVEFSR
jgi:hypothetical protein